MQHKDDPRNIFYNQRQQYQKETASQTTTQETTSQTAGGTTEDTGYQDKLDEMKRLAAKYEREGEGQLVKDIINSVLEQKAAGNLSNDQLIAFAKRVSPLLNADQRQRLDELISQLLKL